MPAMEHLLQDRACSQLDAYWSNTTFSLFCFIVLFSFVLQCFVLHSVVRKSRRRNSLVLHRGWGSGDTRRGPLSLYFWFVWNAGVTKKKTNNKCKKSRKFTWVVTVAFHVTIDLKEPQAKPFRHEVSSLCTACSTWSVEPRHAHWKQIQWLESSLCVDNVKLIKLVIL